MHREYVGIDLHRRRSVIVRKNAHGELVSKTHIDNDPIALAQAVAAAGPEPDVVLEATYGWYWVADLLQEMGARVHLAHPLGNNWGHRRVKNDERDAADLVDLLRLGRLAEAWIAPPETRELRELVRYRHKLMRLRSGLKAQVHAVMSKNGVLPCRRDMFGPGGTAQLDALELPMAYSLRLESLRDLIELYTREIATLDRRIHLALRKDLGYRAIQAIHGVGPVLAAVFVAEIGDVTRFSSPERLCSWAGLTPRHRESDTKVRRGSITKMGSKLVRWAAVEAITQEPRRGQDQSRLPPHRRATGSQHRARGRRPQSAHPRVLRPARRRDPLPGADQRGVSGSDAVSSQLGFGMTPRSGAVALCD
ncbi:MAG: IS110 family transposase [Actinomycetota bacterium]|nr:IS110 family transposase [Actinomycetota bacterium]